MSGVSDVMSGGHFCCCSAASEYIFRSKFSGFDIMYFKCTDGQKGNFFFFSDTIFFYPQIIAKLMIYFIIFVLKSEEL